MKTYIFILIAILAGLTVPVQAGLNVKLGKSVDSPIFASFVSFVIGAASLLIYLLVTKFDFGSVSQTKSVPYFVWTSGLLGAFFVTAIIILSPKLGAAPTLSIMIVAQLLLSLVFDHFGLLGFSIHQINWQKLVGTVLLLVGVFMIEKFN